MCVEVCDHFLITVSLQLQSDAPPFIFTDILVKGSKVVRNLIGDLYSDCYTDVVKYQPHPQVLPYYIFNVAHRKGATLRRPRHLGMRLVKYLPAL